jgi:small subunit ribosomal protein S18
MSDQEQPQAAPAPAAPAPAAPAPAAPAPAAPAPAAPSQSSERRSSYPRGPRTERRGPGGKFAARPKVCQFCVEKKKIDYKAPEQLRRFVSDRGKIRPRRQTGTCARHQRHLSLAIKRARHLALLPFVGNQAR